MRDDAAGVFSVGPPASIPNSNTSQARFDESTPMSRSYNLRCEGSRKRHPRALGFDDLIRDLRCSDIVFAVFVVKSITLSFEGLRAEGGKMDLGPI
jgi:hypothetical protein